MLSAIEDGTWVPPKSGQKPRMPSKRQTQAGSTLSSVFESSDSEDGDMDVRAPSETQLRQSGTASSSRNTIPSPLGYGPPILAFLPVALPVRQPHVQNARIMSAGALGFTIAPSNGSTLSGHECGCQTLLCSTHANMMLSSSSACLSHGRPPVPQNLPPAYSTAPPPRSFDAESRFCGASVC